MRLRQARRRKQLTPEQEAELQQIGDAAQLANDAAVGLMQEIRDLGKLPNEVRGDSAEQVKERKLAERLRRARRRSALTAEQEAELAGLREREVGPLAEVNVPPDPLDPFCRRVRQPFGAGSLEIGIRSRP